MTGIRPAERLCRRPPAPGRDRRCPPGASPSVIPAEIGVQR